MSTANLDSAFSIANLRLAWRRLNTNTQVIFKNYFRDIYRAYAISLDENLKDLRERLLNESYLPLQATKLFLPKKSGLQRTYSLLCVEDQIVYQALVNIVANRFYPKAKPKYNKIVFGNLYAGSRSPFFYRDWHKVYANFGKQIRNAYKRGFDYTASFDLAACFDSIDHSVLRHFLSNLDLEKEFIDRQVEYLVHWTITSSSEVIRQGHGIPQGPSASGLLAEVVLSHFDDNYHKNKNSWVYFRYVDDIRFLAKSEHSLRKLILEMDLLCKQVGLYPQTSKIDIHKIENIEEEIRTIDYPPEEEAQKSDPNQSSIRKRLKQLAPLGIVKSETRFKYVLSVAAPEEGLSNKLITVVRKQPHLYYSVFMYFSRYEQFSPSLSKKLLELLKYNELYSAHTALGLRVIYGKYHIDERQPFLDYCTKIVSGPPKAETELLSACAAILMSENRCNFKEICDFALSSENWLTRSEVLRSIPIFQIGTPSYEWIVNEALKDSYPDVALIAAEIIGTRSLKITTATKQINPLAQHALKEMGILSQTVNGICQISKHFQLMLGEKIAPIEWKKILGKHYQFDIGKAARIRAASETDATNWVNLLDAMHDDPLDALGAHDKTIGGYQHGNIGGYLTKTSAFAQKYPKAFAVFSAIHKKRLSSALSHSVVRSKRKGKLRTRFVEFKYISRMRNGLISAYLEIWSKW